jgi:hypothetical protein
MSYTHLILLSFVLFYSSQNCLGQPISGNYGNLSIAYDSSQNRITGYFNDATGWDDELQEPKFTCTFYINGYYTDSSSQITSFYPGDSINQIKGFIKNVTPHAINLKLEEEHGGCWNVAPLDSTGHTFTLESENNCLSIRYVKTEKAYFHSKPSKKGLLESFLVHHDIVYVYYIKDDWVYVQFYNGEKQTDGWIKVSDLNP